MSGGEGAYITRGIEPEDTKQGFSCGVHALDDYFARHALVNDARGVGRTYVLRRVADHDESLPAVLGFYTLSMASAESAHVARVIGRKLPAYPMPVAMIGRLAVDRRAQRRRVGERLLLDALRRVFDASRILGCTGVLVDAKDEDAEGFYVKYDFSTVTAGAWPRRMFLPIGTLRAAFAP